MNHRFVSGVLAIFMTAHPAIVFANEAFATAETTYWENGVLFQSSIYAVADQVAVEGDYVFDGFAMTAAEGGRVVPLTVRVPAEPTPPDMVAFASMVGAHSEEIHRYGFEFPGGSVEKTVLEVSSGDITGILTITDDPLPIVAWLAIAAASSVIVPVGIYMWDCEKISTRATFDLEGKASFETSCERTP